MTHNNNGFNSTPESQADCEPHYNRGFTAGQYHYERTIAGAGANTPRSGFRYDTPQHNAWSFGYSEGWKRARKEDELAIQRYHTDHATE